MSRPSKTLKDYTGIRFNKLTAITHYYDRAKGLTIWICECDCGARVHRAAKVLRTYAKSTACKDCQKMQRTGKGIYARKDWLNTKGIPHPDTYARKTLAEQRARLNLTSEVRGVK